MSAPIDDVVDRLEEKGLTWKSYAEDYPGGCYLERFAGEGHLSPRASATALYAKQHIYTAAAVRIGTNRSGALSAGGKRSRLHARCTDRAIFPTIRSTRPTCSTMVTTHRSRRGRHGSTRFVQSLQGTLAMHQRTLLVVVWDEGGRTTLTTTRFSQSSSATSWRPGATMRGSLTMACCVLSKVIFGLEPLREGDRNGVAGASRNVWRDSPLA